MEGARAEYCKTVAGAQSNLSNLRVIEEEQEQAMLEELERQAAEECAGCLDKPWKQYPEVQEFLAQFEPDVKLKRRKTLVLDGASKRGKTEFAKSLVPEGEGLEVNCSNAKEEPPLQGLYKPTQHTLILFDECSADLMIKNKRLFQGPNVRVTMGSTQSNRFTYQAWVFRKRMVIGSNHWKKQLKNLEKKDREWIRDNTIYLKVSGVMWEE